MQRLVILRHAKAVRFHESGDDFARVLSKRGRRDATAIGRRLADYGARDFDCALVSSAARTRETWDRAGDALTAARVEHRDELYLAGASTLMSAVRLQADARSLILVGHNPGMHELAITLARGGEDHDATALARLFEGFPTGWACVFALDGPARLEAFLSPISD